MDKYSKFLAYVRNLSIVIDYAGFATKLVETFFVSFQEMSAEAPAFQPSSMAIPACFALFILLRVQFVEGGIV